MHSQCFVLLQKPDAPAVVLTPEGNLLFKFTEHVLRDWLAHVGVKTLFMKLGSPCENGNEESFNEKLLWKVER